jgi:pimeloyl-ACP methyl ester carboxylesterase
MSQTTQNAVSVVLVHGAWADGSSWSRIIPLLQAEGLTVVAAQLPLTSLADDVAAAKRALISVLGPVVLVGHSWGGMIVTEAGDDPKVAALVYVAAFSGAEGQSTGELVNAHPKPPALETIRDDGNGFVYVTEQGMIENVAPDLPQVEARTMAATQGPLAARTFADKLTKAAWKTRPSWYIVSANDRCVSVDLERGAAKLMGSTTTELASGHLSLMSHPEEVARVILQAVSAVSARQ